VSLESYFLLLLLVLRISRACHVVSVRSRGTRATSGSRSTQTRGGQTPSTIYTSTVHVHVVVSVTFLVFSLRVCEDVGKNRDVFHLINLQLM